jgi:hypothetical protein
MKCPHTRDRRGQHSQHVEDRRHSFMGIFRRRPALTDQQMEQLRETATGWIVLGFRAVVGMPEDLVEFHGVTSDRSPSPLLLSPSFRRWAERHVPRPDFSERPHMSAVLAMVRTIASASLGN